MPRFVILEHDHPVLHWDLMLEAGDVLQSWRLAQPPELGVVIEATRSAFAVAQPVATALGDHRAMYLDYEGPVSGGRGTVKRWDAGEFSDDADSVPEARRLSIRGARVQGGILLAKVDGNVWRFEWRRGGS